MSIQDTILRIIDSVRTNTPQTDWVGSTYEEIWRLEIDQRGQVGELLCQSVLKAKGCAVVYEKDITRQSKDWDIEVDNMKIEVKLACRGKNTNTFQHENLVKTRHFDGLILIDVAPEKIYLTCIAKNDLLWQKMHRRKDSIFYKYDLTVNMLESADAAIETEDDFYDKFLVMKRRINSTT